MKKLKLSHISTSCLSHPMLHLKPLNSSMYESGTKSYGEVTDLLISWYLQEIYLPAHADDKTEDSFDPFDKEDVFGEKAVG